jgi:hypothetical protein
MRPLRIPRARVRSLFANPRGFGHQRQSGFHEPWREDQSIQFRSRLHDEGKILFDFGEPAEINCRGKEATPGRAGDPALQTVREVPRNAVIGNNVFDAGANELFKYSQKQNCRFYSIIRDQTGSTSKQRYKELRSLVESHFYILLRSDRSRRSRAQAGQARRE